MTISDSAVSWGTVYNKCSQKNDGKERIQPKFDLETAVKRQTKQQALQIFDANTGLAIKPLAKFEGNITQKRQEGILFSLSDYLELVDYTGRMLGPNKRGAISKTLPPILTRLNLNSKQWLEQTTTFKPCYQKQFSKPRVSDNTKVA
jgi:hypothetical protein